MDCSFILLLALVDDNDLDAAMVCKKLQLWLGDEFHWGTNLGKPSDAREVQLDLHQLMLQRYVSKKGDKFSITDDGLKALAKNKLIAFVIRQMKKNPKLSN